MGVAIGINPGYLKLRKIRAAQSIARTVRKLNLASLRNLSILSINCIFIFYSLHRRRTASI